MNRFWNVYDFKWPLTNDSCTVRLVWLLIVWEVGVLYLRSRTHILYATVNWPLLNHIPGLVTVKNTIALHGQKSLQHKLKSSWLSFKCIRVIKTFKHHWLFNYLFTLVCIKHLTVFNLLNIYTNKNKKFTC